MSSFLNMTLPCDEYINCPGRDRKGGCTNVIPQVISCTGANKGKHYQRCEICGYFWWIPPSVLFGASPSPSPSPARASGFNGHLPASSVSSSSTPTPPPIPQPAFVPLSQPAKAPKPMCSGTSCYTPQTLACSKKMCKKCCERAPGVSSADGFTFKKAVPPALLADTQRRWGEHDAEVVEAASRVENERRIKHSVFLAVYLEENMPPDTIPLQGINTWPTLCLAQILTLSSLLNGIEPALLELLIEKTGTWTSLSFAFKVNTDDTITIRRKGLISLAPTHTLSSLEELELDIVDLSEDLPSMPAICDARDGTWDEGYVFVPPLAKKSGRMGCMLETWPRLRPLAAGSGRLDEHFPQVFPGVPFSSSTYQLNRKFWKALTVASTKLREICPE
ncbi:hypothetical protein BJ912DRAFT_1111278 [Pholiota molesta]|nr:hypothetical protein BJ912DRAFT_1111278 [Pholiota molesta]